MEREPRKRGLSAEGSSLTEGNKPISLYPSDMEAFRMQMASTPLPQDTEISGTLDTLARTPQFS